MSSRSFLKNALKDFRIGAILPSSKYVGNKIAQLCGDSQHILEYGPGDGAITKILLQSLLSLRSLQVIELNKNFVQELNRLLDSRFSVLHGDVLTILENNILQKNSFDAIISGIPFSFLKPTEREKIILNTLPLLKENGKFIAYQATPLLLPLLKKHFKKVTLDIVWQNLPPYFIMTGIK